MTGKRRIRFALIALGAVAILLVATVSGAAQCSLCRSALSGSPTGVRLSKSLNLAILVLLIPPVMIFCGIFLAAFKYRKTSGEAGEKGRRWLTRQSSGRRKPQQEREGGGSSAIA
ncbi:MAG TPA: hypothetical protein VF791_24795 [Pyrinomonadaceae bacterium]